MNGGGDLVYVLSTRTPGTDCMHLYLGVGNGNVVGYAEHKDLSVISDLNWNPD
jgi:hypothetical protein